VRANTGAKTEGLPTTFIELALYDLPFHGGYGDEHLDGTIDIGNQRTGGDFADFDCLALQKR
jgi:hypothetical protein